MRFLSFLLSGVVAFTSFAGIKASANTDNNVENASKKEYRTYFDNKDGYVLISEETFTDENGMQITEKTYVKDEIVLYDDLERKVLTVSKSRLYSPSGIDWCELWIDGTFAYYPGANTCFFKRSESDSGYEVLHGTATVTSESQNYDSNVSGLFGKKYAYFEQKLSLDSGTWGGKKDFRIRVEVNSSGKDTWKY